MRRRKKRRRRGLDIPLTPLIDIVFLLLIYFLLTTNFLVNQGLTVDLPESEQATPQERREITVRVERSGEFLLEGEAVDAPALLGGLKTLLPTLKEAVVVIQADRDVPLKEAVRAMDISKAAGAERLLLATDQKGAR